MFSKRLYLHGSLHSDKNTELDRFLAIHHFDNSIELFLKIIATQENVSSKKRQDFMFKDLWNEVNIKLEKKTSPYTLPLKDQMFNIHETRNLAQHQGDAPSFETVVKYKGYLKDFFVKCFSDIFSIEFDKVYESILILDKKIRNALIEAEENLQKDNFKESMKSSTRSFAFLKLKENDLLSEKLRAFTQFGVFGNRRKITFSNIGFGLIENNYADINRAFKDFTNELNINLEEGDRKITDFVKTFEEELAILKLGVDYKSYIHFSKISPHALFVVGSSEPHISETKEENYSKENALFCYEFVLEIALKLQSLDTNDDDKPD